MATKLQATPQFEKELDRLSGKYHRVTEEVAVLGDQLKRDERPGDKIPRVGYDVYKVRLKNPSAGRGKSGGFRVIYYVHVADFVLLLTIYSKSEYDDMSPARLRQLIEEYMPPDDESAGEE